jgi:hypothetical protein
VGSSVACVVVDVVSIGFKATNGSIQQLISGVNQGIFVVAHTYGSCDDSMRRDSLSAFLIGAGEGEGY